MAHTKFSRLIKNKLLDLEMKQTDLAALLGITKQALNNKMGNEVFNKKDMEKIADALNCDLVIQLVDRDEDYAAVRQNLISKAEESKQLKTSQAV